MHFPGESLVLTAYRTSDRIGIGACNSKDTDAGAEAPELPRVLKRGPEKAPDGIMSRILVDLLSSPSPESDDASLLVISPSPQFILEEPEDDTKAECIAHIISMFPDICPEYLSRIAAERRYDITAVSTHIVDQAESGNSYPKRPNLKRKRSDFEAEDPVAEAIRKYDSPFRHDEAKAASYSRKA